MKITQETDLAKWPGILVNQPNDSYRHFVEGVQHTGHGTVAIMSWQTRGYDPTTAAVGAVLGQHLAPNQPISYTRMRIIINGAGWQYEEAAHYMPGRLGRIAHAFANVAFEAAGAQQQFLNDGAGLVTLAINFARELSPDGIADPVVSDNLGGAFVSKLSVVPEMLPANE